MTAWRRLALAALLSAVGVVASSCASSDGDSESSPAETPEEVAEAPDATPEAERDGAAGRGRYRMVVDEAPSRAGARAQRYAFRIERSPEHTVRDFQVEHTKRMHLIVVRSDLTGFQHLHPTMADDGTWRGSIRLRNGGEYRMFADFKHAGKRRTLAADVPVDGEFKRVRLPAPGPYARTDGGLDVGLYHHGSGAGVPAHVQFEVAEQSRPVTAELQPYLGAMGHLVAIREDDLRYLHAPGRGCAGLPRRVPDRRQLPRLRAVPAPRPGSHGRLHGGGPRVSRHLPKCTRQRASAQARASCSSRAGSARMSIATIFPSATVKPITA